MPFKYHLSLAPVIRIGIQQHCLLSSILWHYLLWAESWIGVKSLVIHLYHLYDMFRKWCER